MNWLYGPQAYMHTKRVIYSYKTLQITWKFIIVYKTIWYLSCHWVINNMKIEQDKPSWSFCTLVRVQCLPKKVHTLLNILSVLFPYMRASLRCSKLLYKHFWCSWQQSSVASGILWHHVLPRNFIFKVSGLIGISDQQDMLVQFS